MTTISELTDLEAEKELTELLGGLVCGGPIKPYATSYDAIIPALQNIGEGKPHGLYIVMEANWIIYLFNKLPIQFTWVDFMKKTPRELLNAAIEALESK